MALDFHVSYFTTMNLLTTTGDTIANYEKLGILKEEFKKLYELLEITLI